MGEFPLLQTIRDDFAARDLAIVNVSVHADCERSAATMAEHRLEWPQVCDGKGFGGELPRLFGVEGTPTQYVLDREGLIAGKVHASLLRTAVARALREGSDAAAGRDLIRSELRRDRWQKVPDMLHAMRVAPGHVLADVGAGGGFFTVRLSDAVGREGRVHAVDISPAEVEKLRDRVDAERRTNVEVVEGATDDPRLPRDTLDAALIVNAYHEMEAHREMLAHLHAALKPGGRLVIEDRIAEARRAMPRDQQVKVHEISPELVEDELRAAGFDILGRREPFTRDDDRGPRWLVIARKPAS